jgi:hypothetical protein
MMKIVPSYPILFPAATFLPLWLTAIASLLNTQRLV